MRNPPTVLFVSGSIGLGHVTRDLAIAAAMRARCPGLRLVWLAGDPARRALQEAGEQLAPEAEGYADETSCVEALAEEFSLYLTNPVTYLRSPRAIRAVLRLRRGFKSNLALIRELTARERFDLIVGDEAFEFLVSRPWKPALRPAPLAMIFDFVGLDPGSQNPLEWLAVRLGTWLGAPLVARFPRWFDQSLLIGDLEDVADQPLGPFLQNRRAWAQAITTCVGYVLQFDPADYQDLPALRQRLGYGPEPLIVCAIGGTAIGRDLLELCGRAYPLLRQARPGLRMVAVCGPRLAPEALVLPAGVERRGYVPRLYEHLAACDLAVVQGGGTTTLELTALRRPFLYFPLEGHFEQRFHVSGRLRRHGAGVRLEYRDMTPESLAEAILAHLGRLVTYPPIPTDGAARAAAVLCALMSGPRLPGFIPPPRQDIGPDPVPPT